MPDLILPSEATVIRRRDHRAKEFTARLASDLYERRHTKTTVQTLGVSGDRERANLHVCCEMSLHPPVSARTSG